MRKLRAVALVLLSLVVLVAAFAAWRWHQFREDRALRVADAERAPLVARARPVTPPPTAPGSACIAGRVVDGEVPLAGAQVSLSSAPPSTSADCPCVGVNASACACADGLERIEQNPRVGMLEAVQSVISASDGSFSLCGLSDLKPRLVWAEHSDGRVALRTDGPGEVRAGASVVLRVQHTVPVDGVVVSDDGPVRGARITAFPVPQVTTVSITPDERGRFRAPLLNGTHLFVVSAPGFAAQEFRRRVPEGALVLKLARLVEVTVRVEHEGRPAADASVWSAREAPTQTDAQGLARLSVRRDLRSTLSARKGLLVASAKLNVQRDPPPVVVLALEQGEALRGTVVDERGAPVADATVEVEDLDDALTTDAEGRFSTPPLSRRQIGLSVKRDGCSQHRRFVRPGVENDLKVELRCAPSASGHVVDAAGNAIEGAKLTLSLADDSITAMSGADGRFDFFGTGPGLVTVTHERYQKTQQPLTLPKHEETTIVLDAAASISGHVLDEAGKPVPHAKVGTFPVFSAEANPDDVLSTYTDADGRFELHGARAGRFVLTTAVDGRGESTTEPFTLQPGEQRDGFVIHLDAKVDLRGVVLDERRQPIPGASINRGRPEKDDDFGPIVARYIAGDFSAMTALSPVSATTDADGRFELRNLSGDSSLLTVHAMGFKSLTKVPARRGDTVELVMKRNGTVRGRVVDEASHPLRTFEVDGSTFSDGAFELQASSRIRVTAKGFLPRSVDLEGDGDVDLHDITLTRAGTLRVTVKSDTDKPFIAVVNAGNSVCRTSEVPWCDLEGLRDGPLEVHVKARLHLAVQRAVKVEERAKGLEVTLQLAKGQLVGTASAKPGAPAAGAELKVSGASSTTAITDATGAFSVVGLEEGPACLMLSLPGNLVSEWSTPALAATPPQPVAVGPVSGGATVEVSKLMTSVRLVQGAHTAEVLASLARNEPCLALKTTTVMSGNFGAVRVEGLPPGTWTLQSWNPLDEEGTRTLQVIELAPGETRRF